MSDFESWLHNYRGRSRRSRWLWRSIRVVEAILGTVIGAVVLFVIVGVGLAVLILPLASIGRML